MGERQAASFVLDESTGRSVSLPFSNTAPGRNEGNQVRRVHSAPACLSGLDQLERHREPGRPRARPLGNLAPQTHCRESRFDGVRRAQMDPMLRRVVVELQQHVGVVDDLRRGLRELRAVVSFERGDRRPRLVGVLGVVDFPSSPPPRPDAPTSEAQQGYSPACGTNNAAPSSAGRRRVALSRSPAHRRRPRGSGRACRGGGSRAAGRPTTRATRGTRRSARRAPCLRPRRPCVPGVAASCCLTSRTGNSFHWGHGFWLLGDYSVTTGHDSLFVNAAHKGL